ncbi:hypothetical protein DL98DRAFT_236039 [Cadophora sp. DSE1049]|nr:hypothetical protein DL98DRAFT_236039 [Cadophora sp. DSE1049]
MNQPGVSKSKVTASDKKNKTVHDAQPKIPSARHPSIQPIAIAKKNKKYGVTTTSTDTDDADLPPPPKKTKVDKLELQARQVKAVSPYLVEIERLKGQHITEVKKLKEEYKAEVEKFKDEDEELQHIQAVNKLKEEHQAEIERLKQQTEELKHTIEAQKSEIRIQEHLVQVGAAVRGRWFELAKGSAGVGQPVAAIVEAGERAITRGNIRADLAMLQLGYAALPSGKLAR